MKPIDVVILGAGIVGSACAYECALAGMRVAVVEPSIPSGMATAAGMGHLVAMDDSPAQLALSHFSRELWRDLRSALPPGVEYEECGTLWVAADAQEMEQVFAKRRTYATSGIDTEVLDEMALREAEPGLRPGLAGGLLVPHDGVIYPPAAASYFLSVAQEHGAQLILGKKPVHAANGEVTFEDGTHLSAGNIVIATGTDTALCSWLTLHPRKGHLVITDRYPGFVRHQLVELGYLKSAHSVATDSVAFNVQPRRTGQLLIGSSRQYGELPAKADPAILRKMLDRAVEYMPDLKPLSGLRVWTGFRAASLDKLPLIGPTPDRSVLIAMGFEGLGITNAPGAAKLVLHYLTGAAVPVDPQPFHPGRVQTAEPLYA